MAKSAFRVRDAVGWAFRKLSIWTSADAEDVGTSPTITSGAGAPSGTANGGSVYLRTDGDAATTVYSYDTDSNSWTAR